MRSVAVSLARAASSVAPAAEMKSQVLRHVVPLTPAHAEAAAKCVAAAFSVSGGARGRGAAVAAAAAAASGTLPDPFTAAFGFTGAPWVRLCSPFIARAAVAPQLSSVSINDSTGEVDGLMAVDDYTKQPPALYRGLPKEWAPTRAIFRELYTRFDATPLAPRDAGTTAQCLYFSCVRPSARGQGVMLDLWRKTIERARDRGFSSIVASAAHPVAHRILSVGLGFDEVAAVRFKDFAQDTGLAAFAKLSPAYEKLALYRRKLPSDLYV